MPLKPVQFIYRNHKGETELRKVIPECVEFIERPGYDYQPGWFLSAHDLERDARRSFRLSNIVLVQGERIKLEAE